MRQYLDLLARLRKHGHEKGDRTGTGALSLFGAQMRFDLAQGFPLLTTKKLPQSIIYELLWFQARPTRYLNGTGSASDEWADANGELGPVYGQWRSWPPPTSISIRSPRLWRAQARSDRAAIVSAWNVGELDRMALPPATACSSSMWRRQLSCQLYQRSADMFLGVPFNIASYAPDADGGVSDGKPEFVHTFGDVHLYLNHVDQADEQLTRSPTLCRALKTRGHLVRFRL